MLVPTLVTRSIRSAAALAVLNGAASAPAAAQTHASAALPTDRPTAGQITAALDSLADSLTRGPVVGMTIVVARGPAVLVARGYGMADREAAEPAAAASVYQIGSVTKQFTAAAILRLVEQGRIALDDEITKYLPDFPPQGNTVTIRHLLNHTSGIRSYTSFMRLTDSMPVAVIYDSIKTQPFDFEPGTDFRYNNSGYVLLGLVLERVTGEEYADLMQEWFFTPLGMTDTRYCGRGGAALPEGYRPGLMGSAMRVPAIDMRVPFAAGALCSTAPDLARWTWALATGKVVKPASYAAMTAGTTLSTGRRVGYGYGLVADTAHGRAAVFHGGGIPGFLSDVAHFPADSTIVVTLLNTEADIGPITERIQHIVLGVEPEVVAGQPVPAEVRDRLLGTYSLSEKLDVRIFAVGDTLVAQGTGQPAFRLLYQGHDEFRATFDPKVRLVFQPGSPAAGFTLHQGGATIEAVRKPE